MYNCQNGKDFCSNGKSFRFGSDFPSFLLFSYAELLQGVLWEQIKCNDKKHKVRLVIFNLFFFFAPFMQMRGRKSFFVCLSLMTRSSELYIYCRPCIIQCFVKDWDKHSSDVVDTEYDDGMCTFAVSLAHSFSYAIFSLLSIITYSLP